MLVWTPWALPALLAATALVAAAAFMFFSAPHRRVNRLAALVCFVDAAHILASGAFSAVVLDDPVAFHAAIRLHYMLDAVQIPIYLAFIGVALDTPLVRPFRDPRIIAAATLPALGFVALLLLAPQVVIIQTAPVDHWMFHTFVAAAWPINVVFLLAAATFLYALAAAIHSLHRARTPERRAQARAYVIAFGVHDAGPIVVFSSLFLLQLLAQPESIPDAFAVLALWSSTTYLLFAPLLVYGVVRSQLLDIDLKIKLGISRGAVAAVFIGAFVVAFTITEQWLQERYGWLFGGAAVGLLLIGFRRIERLGDRLADTAMPRVQDTEEYRTVRKREVYTAAIESALQDGEITFKERSMLATLADQLGLTSAEALSLERTAVTARGEVN